MPFTTGKGHCLCGAVTLVANGLGQHVDACHCRMCRTWSGGPLFAVECDGSVTFQGEEHVTVYDSSEWAQRGFCSRCGTHLFYRLKEKPWYEIPAGLLEDQALILRQQIFIDEKPDYYELANDTPRLTGEEFLTKYGTS